VNGVPPEMVPDGEPESVSVRPSTTLAAEETVIVSVAVDAA